MKVLFSILNKLMDYILMDGKGLSIKLQQFGVMIGHLEVQL